MILILRVDTLSCFKSLNRIDSMNYGKLGHYNVIVGFFSIVTGSGKIMHGHIFVHAPLIHQALGEKVATLVKNKQTIFFSDGSLLFQRSAFAGELVTLSVGE